MVCCKEPWADHRSKDISLKGYGKKPALETKSTSKMLGSSLSTQPLHLLARIIGPTIFFDNAARQVCTVKSVRTNTPLQALALFNDVTYVEAARALADRAMESNKKDADRIRQIFLSLLAREPLGKETDLLLAALERSRSQFEQNPQLAIDLVSVGDSKIGEREILPSLLAGRLSLWRSSISMKH